MKELVQNLRKSFRVSKKGFLIRKCAIGGTTFKGEKIHGWQDHRGYKNITFRQKTYKLHRVVFAIENGYFPKQIDHVNRIKHDNRIKNLRAANAKLNSWNKQAYKNTKFGGNICRYGKGYKARVWRNGKTVFNKYSNDLSKLKKLLREFKKVDKAVLDANFHKREITQNL